MMPSSFGFALVLASVAKGAVLVGLVAALIALLRIRSASLRHAFWTSVVLAHLAIPVLTVMLPPVRMALPGWIPAALTGPESSREFPSDVETVPTMDLTVPATAVATTAVATTAGGSGRGGFATTPRATTVVVLGDQPVIVASEPGSPTPVPAAVGGLGAGRGEGVGYAFGGARPEGRPRSLRDAMRTVLSWPAPSPLTILWIVGCLVVLVRLAAGTSRVARLAHTAQPVIDPSWLLLLHEVSRELEITRPITLLRGNRLSVPVTWGIVYPVVLLPEDADSWQPERRRHVLLHELAHVRRFDALTQLAGQCVLALLWFDPLVWYAVHRMRVERERACDDVVLRRGSSASRYASDLLDMVRALDTAPIDATPAFATLAMARKHDFEGRMLAILDPKPDRRMLGARGTAAATAALAMMLIPLSAVRGRRAEAATWSKDFAAVATTSPAPAPFDVLLDTSQFDTVRKQMEWADSLRLELTSPEAQLESARLVQQIRDSQQHLGEIIAATPTVAPLPPTPAAAPELAAVSSASECERLKGQGNSTSIHSNSSDDHPKTFSFTSRNEKRCAHIEVIGDVTFNDQATDIEQLGPESHIQIQELAPNGLLREFVASNQNGTTERDYSENGRPASFDADARAWLSAMIEEMVRETGIDAKRRVSRLLRQGGVPAVLGEISRINSTGGKRAYYEAMLDSGRLDERDVLNLVTNVGRDLSPSSGDLSAVLTKLRSIHGSPELYAALDDALGHIDSDGDRARALTTYVGAAANDRDLLLVVLRAARGISSDGDKSSVLVQAGPQALATGDDALREQYFRTARSIGSDGDLSRVLVSVVSFGHASPATARDLIQSAKKIGSDGDKANVLVAIANARLLTTRDLQDAYIDAARSIGSDGDYRRVMESTLRR
jgi:beta-lactamase regulating signal transducer with metallopeptidase domain